MTVKCLLITIAAMATPSAEAASFFAIGPDPSTFVPDQLVSVATSPQAVNTIATLGGGLLAFNGGLTTGPGGLLYTIANDPSGSGSFYSIQTDGTLSLIGGAGGLGFGFLGGLSYDSANSTFYAAVNDSGGNTSLYSITAGGTAIATGLSLGTGFSGLAYDSATNLFSGIGNDNNGSSTLYSFALAGPVTTVGSLGFGFGALTYDSASDTFWAIDPVNNFSSQLFRVPANATGLTAGFTLGDGFSELAVVSAPITSQAPELGTLPLLGSAGTLAGYLLLRRKSCTETGRH
jgi:hypothetical protein